MKTRLLQFLLSTAIVISTAVVSHAELLGVAPSYPLVRFSGTSATSLSYEPSLQLLSVSTNPSSVRFTETEAARLVTGTRSLVIRAIVDQDGRYVSGMDGADFELRGTVNRDGTIYSDVLLSGEVTGFGFAEAGVTDVYDFSLSPTGGQLLSFFSGGASITVSSTPSTFGGDFGVAFSGRTAGNLGAQTFDNTPPAVTCPLPIIVECNATSGGLEGAFVSYAPVSVVDDTDPNPTVTITPASGSFFNLPAGQPSATYPVKIEATDAAGNKSECTFNVTVQDTMPPAFDPDASPILLACAEPIVLETDPGTCAATYTFTLPVAYDACLPGVSVPVTASAVDVYDNVVNLTPTQDGRLQGVFPVTNFNTEKGNVITFIANDGRGNTSRAQCIILVEDKEAPSMVCVDQTATFKPILARSYSSINGDFSCNKIEAGDTIWFSSVYSAPSNVRGPYTVRMYDQKIELNVDGQLTTLDVPEAFVRVIPGVSSATTSFINGKWQTVTAELTSPNTFVSGLAYQLPATIGGCTSKKCGYSKCSSSKSSHKRSKISATWCARFDIDKPGLLLRWGWAAAAYTEFSQNYNALGVKPIDSQNANSYPNRNAAGTPECFKQFVIPGARGDGDMCRWGRNDKFTGELTELRRANLGVGATCMGPVVFDPPSVTDNCDTAVTVTCSPESGSVFGPGIYTITCTAEDSAGNVNTCDFQLTVVQPLQVVFESPCDDNITDNTAQEDEGWSNFNAPDAPTTPQILNRFCVGEKICHTIRLRDCEGNDVTDELIRSNAVTVNIDVTERVGDYATSTIVNDIAEQYSSVGSPGGIMVPNCGRFRYCLDTGRGGFSSNTICSQKFYRSTVWVEYNTSRGLPVGMEDVILESR